MSNPTDKDPKPDLLSQAKAASERPATEAEKMFFDLIVGKPDDIRKIGDKAVEDLLRGGGDE